MLSIMYLPLFSHLDERILYSSDSLKAISTPLALEAQEEDMIEFFTQPHWLVHILSLDAELCVS